jgi:RNA polymerase sigma-70 factor (ECF subfamily)
METNVLHWVLGSKTEVLQKENMPPLAAVARATEQSDIGSIGFKRTDPDASLVAAAKCGDVTSIETLIQRRQAKVLRLAETITRNHADAEEAVQNAFFLAFRRLNTFQGQSQFSTWLSRITVNQSLVALRRRRVRDVPLDLATESVHGGESVELGDHAPSPEECVSQREREALLVAAVQRLKPSFRSAIEVHYLQENSTEDTARILQLSGEAVKSRLHRARKKLREALKEHMPAEMAAAG